MAESTLTSDTGELLQVTFYPEWLTDKTGSGVELRLSTVNQV
jgi:hypothetical protein